MASLEPCPSRNEPIAIVGSGCRFPGGTNSPSKLWDLLRAPRDVLKEIPPSRFDVRSFHHADSQFPGHANVKHSYLLEDNVTHFDAQFFNITAAEVVAMDPQQRLLLETVYEGLEGAGLTIEGLKGSDTGVYIGLMYVDYESLQFRDLQNIPTYLAIGTARSIISNRISYFFDWHGPSLTVDTACSLSLVAVYQAVQALRAGEVHVALAAGSNLLLGPEPYIYESKLNILSPDGRSRMWDQDANGYARGDSVAAVVLKTLAAALADGDYIECIIRETGVNQDGRSRSITMPSAIAQTALIRDTYARVGLDPTSKTGRGQYFEAHGTGTPASNPVEAEAVHSAFFRPKALAKQEGQPPLFIGSIKTVIGHTESTAGLAGILKVIQAMKDLAWALRSRRSRLPLRLSLPASSVKVLHSNLKDLISNFKLDPRSAATGTNKTRLLGVFTGQGAQWARMGAELIESSKYTVDVVADLNDALLQLPEQDHPSWNLRQELLADTSMSNISSASISQPLCTAVQILLVKLLRLAGIRFTTVVGHSSGKIAAAFTAGYLSAWDAIRIAYYRGLYCNLAGGSDGSQGAMLAVGTSMEDAEEVCSDEVFEGRVNVAACNSPSSVTVSGDEDAIIEVAEMFEDENKFVRRLKVDKAYHSLHMLPCSQPYLDSMRLMSVRNKRLESSCAWVSSVHPDRSMDKIEVLDASY
ncbi:MAG: hypothetical protein Q9197_002976 [Variospora fuerteventurae]